MGFKFGSRLDPKAASAKGSQDTLAAEDTPLNRLRAGLGLQPAAPALSASAALESRRVEPQVLRPAEAAALERSDPKPIETTSVEITTPQIRTPEVKTPEVRT